MLAEVVEGLALVTAELVLAGQIYREAFTLMAELIMSRVTNP